MFVAAGTVQIPDVCLFESESEVVAFQTKAGWSSTRFGDDIVELQPAALDALVAARDEAADLGLEILPRGGSEAGRRCFADSVRLWRSRFDPALEHWCQEGLLERERAESVRELPLRKQVAAVLELEDDGLYFSKDFSKSILRSVAAPGASQHLAMLAFDTMQFHDVRVQEVLRRHGWHQTVLSDLPHFTYLGLTESELPGRGLMRVDSCGQQFWIPNQVKVNRD
jgi:hypothetical protein